MKALDYSGVDTGALATRTGAGRVNRIVSFETMLPIKRAHKARGIFTGGKMKIESYKNFPFADIIDTAVKLGNYKKGNCIGNSRATTHFKKGIKAIYGTVLVDGYEIEHAWNYYDGKYFDATAEIYEIQYTNYEIKKISKKGGLFC